MEFRLKFEERYDLQATLECGQIFRFRDENLLKSGRNNAIHADPSSISTPIGKVYYGPLSDRIIRVEQIDENTLEVSSNKSDDLLNYVNDFFRVNDDYKKMIASISINELMERITKSMYGLHILKQDKMECIVSYFLSMCNNIPRITRDLESICKWGGQTSEMDGYEFYLFPSQEQLSGLTEEILREMGCGFRAKYIAPFVQNVPSFIFDSPTDTDELNKLLLNIHGIGQKVADCIQLFAFGDMGVFPIDTWIAKFMSRYFVSYPSENTGPQRNANSVQQQKKTAGTVKKKKSNRNLRKMRILGRDLFNEWAGYASQFIFHYSRTQETYK